MNSYPSKSWVLLFYFYLLLICCSKDLKAHEQKKQDYELNKKVYGILFFLFYSLKQFLITY